MTATTIIREAQADGVRLALSPTGSIKATGDCAAVNRWLAVLREHKAEIVDVLKIGAGDMATASRWWMLHFCDREPLTVSFSPTATHAELLAWYQDAVAAEPVDAQGRQPSAPWTGDEEHAVVRWLAHIGEQDAATIAEVLTACRRDIEARSYFLERAANELPKPDPFPDDRRTCAQCANLIGQRCQAAKRGEIAANRIYEPVPDTPRRCEGFRGDG